MTRLRSRGTAGVLAALVLLAVALLALALGADAVSLVLGAATVAVAATVLLVVGRPGARRPRPRRKRAPEGGRGRREPGARDRDDRSRGTAGRDARRLERRTVEAIEAAEVRLFSQLEALDWLRAELQLAHPLPPTRGFAAAPDALLQLVRLIDEVAPAQVLETGSGVSSIVIARRLQQRGHGRLTSLEHLAEHAQRTRSELESQGLADVAEVVDAPLEEVTIGDGTWRWYRLSEALPPTIDLLFVDGPPTGTGPLARYPALPLLRQRLAPGATILVDDGDRPDEQDMLRRWQAEATGLKVTHLALAKGAWLVEVPR